MPAESDIAVLRTGVATRASVPVADLAFVVVAGALAFVSFGSVYGGLQYLVAGVVGLLLAAGLVRGADRLGQPSYVVSAAACIAYFLFGPVLCDRGDAFGGVIPSPDAIRVLGVTAFRGWSDLLSIAPPVGSANGLLAVPFLLGIGVGVGALLVTTRSKIPTLALAGPFLILVLGILFGTDSTPSLLAQGAGVSVLTLLWVAYRQRAYRGEELKGVSRLRQAMGAALVVGVALVALQVGPSLPFASSNQRYVLRDHIFPPFNPADYPSPLNEYRTYVTPPLRDEPLFTVQGAAPGTLIRIATMDQYDGTVWGVSEGPPGSSASGDFVPVGDPVSSGGCALAEYCGSATINIRIENYHDVWLPSAGGIQQISFNGPGARALQSSFRYNDVTGTGVVTAGLQNGDTYSVSATIPTKPAASILDSASAAQVALPPVADVPLAHARASAYVRGIPPSPYQQAQAMALRLTETGAYSDGQPSGTASLPGHSIFRLELFLNTSQPVGDAEQYAAAMAVMARSLGLPARVVLGVIMPRSTGNAVTVTGDDVTAWVEVDLAGVGWYPFFPTPSRHKKPSKLPPPPPPALSGQAQTNKLAQPTAENAPPPVNATGHGQLTHVSHHHGAVSSSSFPALIVVLPATPVLVVLGAVLAILIAKRSRRLRRRRAPTYAGKIVGGWLEVVDFARDLGRHVPSTGTRRELALGIGEPVRELAIRADTATFAPAEPDVDDVESYWKLIDRSRAELAAGLSPVRRLRARLSLASLRKKDAKSTR